jgi:glycosyltransferase involved in cell wall biosynthesis
MSARHAAHRPCARGWCIFSPGRRSLDVLRGDTTDSGGAEAQVAYLARSLADRGHEVALLYGDARKRDPERVIAGVRCIDVMPTWRRPASLAPFWRTLQRLAPDVVYARLPNDFLWLLGLFARRRRGTQFVYALANDRHCRPGQAYEYNWWFHTPLYALGLMSASRITAQHAGQLDLASPRLRDRMIQVPNLIRSVCETPRLFHETARDAIWVARIRPVKQLGRFLDLAESLPDLHFAVVGGWDPTFPGMHQRSLELRLRSIRNLVFFGSRNSEDVIGLIRQSKVLVNTSDFEGFPNTMLEAWSVGVPVVSLRVDPGGIIEREQLGFVSGSIDRLRSDVRRLATSQELNRSCGENGLAYVRRQHSLDVVHKALMNGLSINANTALS